MSQRYSAEELYTIRNTIPIQYLIEEVLQIPGKEVEGVFRFVCPICHESQTAVNPRTNLSRCFRCKENFNTIELVMKDRQIGFVESVRFLQQVQKGGYQTLGFAREGGLLRQYGA